VAATDIHRCHSPFQGHFSYDHRSAFPNFHPGFESPAHRPRRPSSSSRSVVRPGVTRSWSNKSGHDGYQGKDFMSERAGGQHPQGSSTRGGNDAGRFPSSSAAPSYHYGHPGHATGNVPPYGARQQPPQPGIQLPPLPPTSNVTSGSFPAPRSTGFSSILNPTEPTDSSQGRRRKADELDSPSRSGASLPPILTGEQRCPPTVTSAYNPAASTIHSRPTLTPRSPSHQHNVASRQFGPPTGTMTMQQSPFMISPRTRVANPDYGSSASTSYSSYATAGRQQSGGHASTVPQHQPTARRSSLSHRRRGPSSSASPSTSYSGISQAGHTSPAGHYAQATSMPTLSSAYRSRPDVEGSGEAAVSAPPSTTSSERQRPLGIPISSAAGQNVYQMMTIETTSGSVQLPVDVQAASRVADEKRRRNAGASARFRQRRKEKEREASTSIAKLDAQVKALAEDAEFYKRERDYLAGVVLQVPGGERHFPRPQSPRHRRSSSVLAGSVSGSADYMSGAEQGMTRSPEQGRNVRRRTSASFAMPPSHVAAHMQPQGPPMTPGYFTHAYAGAPVAPQPGPYHATPGPLPSPMERMSLPGASSMAAGPPPPPQTFQQPGPMHFMQAQPQTGPYNPYAADRRPPLPPPRTQPPDGRQ